MAEQYTNEDTPESVIYDTLKRLGRLEQQDAERVVQALYGFMGFEYVPAETDDE